jgi:ABC-type branched-subunit amino acid transport system ATPase component
VEVGRALAAGALLLLLDEPFSGLTRPEVDRMLATLRGIRAAGTCSILLVEHNLGAVFDLCDDVTAMDQGRVAVSGDVTTVRGSAEVKQAFFGAAPGTEMDDWALRRDAGRSNPVPSGEARAPALDVRELHVGYGRVRAVHGLSLQVRAGEIVGLIGANGAGKTTLFRGIMGLADVSGGQVALGGSVLPRLRPDLVVGAGVSFCPQGRNLFPSLSVEENLRMGGYRGVRGKALAVRVHALLERFTLLGERRYMLAGALSGGQQQLLAIARALMSEPRVLLLDEPSTGLAVGAVRQVAQTLRGLSDEGLAVLVAEQNVSFAAAVCHRGYVIESGRVAAEGSHEVLERAWELTLAESAATPESLSAEQLVRAGGEPAAS